MESYICDYSGKGAAFLDCLSENCSADWKLRGSGYGDSLLRHPIVYLKAPVIFLWSDVSFSYRSISLRREKACALPDNYYFVNWYTLVPPLTPEHRAEVAKKDFGASLTNQEGRFDGDYFKEHFFFPDALHGEDPELQRLMAALEGKKHDK